MKKTAVVILSWNGRKFLEQFLPDVIRFSQDEAEIIIADNASTDDSIEYLQLNFPQIRVIKIEKNAGYAGGYNIALKQIEAEYYVLLNSDVEVTEGWIKPVIEMMNKDSSLAACQPKIRSFYNKEYFEYAGAAGGYIDSLGYPFCRGRIFDTLEKDTGQYDDAVEVFWATGACMFVRSKVFHELGGFDETFFAHMEEIDLCWRMQSRDYKLMYCPTSVVYHVGGGTLPKNNPRKTYLNFRNNLLMIFKNVPGYKLFWIFLARFSLDGIAAIKFLFANHIHDFTAVIKAHFYFYMHLRYVFRKRRETQRGATNKVTKNVFRGSIVLKYYLGGKRKFTDLPPISPKHQGHTPAPLERGIGQK